MNRLVRIPLKAIVVTLIGVIAFIAGWATAGNK